MDKFKTYEFSWEIDDQPDATQFCAKTEDEAITLFEDFCADERIDPTEVNIDVVYDEDDAKEYGDDYISYEEYVNGE